MTIIRLGPDLQRLAGWKVALVALGSHPWRWLFGWGPETFSIAYRLHRTPADALAFKGFAGNAHNIVLELLVTTGLAGFTAVTCLLWYLWENSDEVGQATILGVVLMALVEPIPFQAWALMCLVTGLRHRAFSRVDGGFRFFVNPALLLSVLMWKSNSLAYESERATQANEPFKAWVAAKEAAMFNPASLGALRAKVDAGGTDILDNLRLFHPNDADAAQLGVMASLRAGIEPMALDYARRAAAADPSNPEITEQTAVLEKALR